MMPFPEWAPDQPDFNNPGAKTIKNCIPLTAQSYGPMPTPAVYSSNGLTARCQGSYSIYDPSNSVHIFAGDQTKLYRMTTGSIAFADVSRTVGGAYACPTVADGGFWSMTSFGSRVIATNLTDVVQQFLVGTDTNFTDLAAAPKAKFAATILDFLFLGFLTGLPYRVRWSAIGDPGSYPAIGTAAALQVQSDQQDLQQTDLGRITGIVGGLSSAHGAVFMERGIYRVLYVGSPAIFSFPVAQGALGTRAPMSIVQRRTASGAAVVYYLGEDGFYAFDGANSLPISDQKWSRAFFAELDQGYLSYVQGVADPQTGLIFWAFMGQASGGLFNRIIVYNPTINRAALCDLTATPFEWLTRSIYGTGYTLEGLDAFSTSIDTLPASLDSPLWMGGALFGGIFDTSHKLNVLTGPAMAPVLETGEKQLFPGRRGLVLNARGLVDGGSYSIAVGYRDNLTDTVSWDADVPVNVLGECPQRVTGRYQRFRFKSAASQTFSHLQGIDFDARPEARMR